MADEQSNHQTKRACVNGTNILPWVERWLSPERLAPYLEANECDAEKALELYRWNVALGQFLMRDISYFEVLSAMLTTIRWRLVGMASVTGFSMATLLCAGLS